MPKLNSKLRILYVKEILENYSDENHQLTSTEIIKMLKKYDIQVERKTIYEDIKALKDFGIDIINGDKRKNGYFIGNREFELTEILVLTDAVLSSKFITHKKASNLIDKLKKHLNKYDQSSLKKLLFLQNRMKYENENIFYNVDKVFNAIASKKKISFKYFDFDMDQNIQLRKSGKDYQLSPYGMIWSNENYYIVGNYSKYDSLAHFRVDKMLEVKLLDEKIRDFSEVSEYKNSFDIGDYHRKHISMFSGVVDKVCIKFDISNFQIVRDKWGDTLKIRNKSKSSFEAVFESSIDDGLVTWVISFGEKACVLYPEPLKVMVIERVKKVLSIY
jgi:predicted DNA-binding transcriptional regulator YafY